MKTDSRSIQKLLLSVLIPLLLTAAAQVHPVHTDQPKNERVVTVLAGRNGFNGSTTFAITATEGETLTINFVYGDDDLASDNPHRIMIDGYNVQTDVFGKQGTTSSVTIALGQPGQFRFYCDLPCQGMLNMQNGTLIVLPSPSKSRQTQLTVSPLDIGLTENGMVLSAKLTDEEANEIPGAILGFYVKTTFGGWLRLASTATDGSGAATVRLPYEFRGNREIMVVFPGSGRFKSSNSTIVVSYLPKKAEDAGGLPLPPNFQMAGVSPAANLLVVGMILAVVFSVWFVFGTALYRIVRIRITARSSKELVKGVPATTRSVPVKSLIFLVAATSLLAGVANHSITAFVLGTSSPWAVVTLAAIEALVMTGVVTRYLGKAESE